MPLDSIISDAVLKTTAKIATEKVFTLLQRITKQRDEGNPETIKPNVERHLTKVYNWSRQVEMFKLSQAKNIDSATIELDIYLTPKKFGGHKYENKVNAESLIHTEKDVLLLGDPGAGKTTTVKRLCRSALKEIQKNNDKTNIRIPVLIRLRDLNSGENLYMAILHALGINYYQGKKENQEREDRVYSVGRLIEEVVLEVLDSINALVFVDGLDEISSKMRNEVNKNLGDLSLHTSNVVLFATSRSGEYDKSIEGFDSFEIAPLSPIQIKKIVAKWLKKPDMFMGLIEKSPLGDATNRPLTLIHLLILYINHGYLPEQASGLYKKLLFLYLNEWDYQRSITRQSEYANFYPERKFDFLSVLSFTLMYKMGNTNISFTSGELASAYRMINESFLLPDEEANEVVKEIESHTGIIVAVGEGRFEFSHLSFQEYLCANYMVKTPFMDIIGEYLIQRPAPVAVTLALAPDPGKWLSQMFLSLKFTVRFKNAPTQIDEFLRRLYLERPYFSRSGILGHTLIAIVFAFYERDTIILRMENILTLPNVSESMNMALANYQLKDVGDCSHAVMNKAVRKNTSIGENMRLTEEGYIPRTILLSLARS